MLFPGKIFWQIFMDLVILYADQMMKSHFLKMVEALIWT